MTKNLSIMFELLRLSRSQNEYIKIAQGKFKMPKTLLEVIKHTRDGKRNKHRS